MEIRWLKMHAGKLFLGMLNHQNNILNIIIKKMSIPASKKAERLY